MPAKPSAEVFHAVAADLDYPMAIVTTAYGGERAGCLVGFATQSSLDPPLLVVWLSNKNHTTRLALKASSLLVHFLSRDQRELARLFGAVRGDEVDKLALVGRPALGMLTVRSGRPRTPAWRTPCRAAGA